MKQSTGKLTYEKDSMHYHRFRIESKQGIVGRVYIPKDMKPMPDRIVLDRVKEKGGR